MEKTNQIKSYEEVSKAFTDILRSSLNNEFRSRFYSLLNVTNTNDAEDNLKKKLKQFLKPSALSSTSSKNSLAKLTTSTVHQDRASATISELNCNEGEITEPKKIQEKVRDACISNSTSNMEVIETGSEDQISFNNRHTTFPNNLQLNDEPQSEASPSDLDIQADEFDFGFESNKSIMSKSLQINDEQQTEATPTILIAEADEFDFGFESNTSILTKPSQINEEPQAEPSPSIFIAEADEFHFGFESNKSTVTKSSQINEEPQAGPSPSILIAEANEFDFESNKSIMIKSSQINNQPLTEPSPSVLAVEADEFGFESNKSIISKSSRVNDKPQTGTSPSVLVVEADEFGFGSTKYTSKLSQNEFTENNQSVSTTLIQLDDDFGFYPNSERISPADIIWSATNKNQKPTENNLNDYNSDEMELEDLDLW